MKELIFVYNANSGLVDSFIDTVHKIVSPKTYSCNLCAITYGPLSMKKEWKTFIENLSFSTKFLHRDEFKKKYPKNKETLPAVFIKSGNELTLLVSSKEINRCKTLGDLKKLVKSKIKE